MDTTAHHARSATRRAAYHRGLARGALYGFALGLGVAVAAQYLGLAANKAWGAEIILADPAYEPGHPCDFGYETDCPVEAVPPPVRWLLDPPVPPARGRPAWTYDPPVPAERPTLDEPTG